MTTLLRNSMLLAALLVATVATTSQAENVLLTYNGNSAGLFTSSGQLLVQYSNTLSNPQGITSDGTNVYVSDYGTGQIKEYNGSSGAFIRNVLDNATYNPFGVAWNGTNLGNFSNIGPSGKISTLDTTTTNGFVASNTYSAGYEGLTYNASNNTFYATTSGGFGLVQKFDGTSTTYTGNVFPTADGAPKGLVFDSNNLLYVANAGSGSVTQFNINTSTGTNSFITGLSTPLGLGFDSSDNELAVTEFTGNKVDFFNLSGTELSSFAITDPAYLAFTTINSPEPSSVVALCGLGAMGLFIAVRRRRKA